MLKLSNALRSAAPLALAVLILATPAAPGRDVAELYTRYCASCHGANLAGGQTESLLEGNWKHGTDDISLARTIREGLTNNGMPTMRGALSEPEIRAMVVYIREKTTQAEGRRTVWPQPAEGQVTASREHRFQLERVAGGLSTPWAVAFLPDGRGLVTELPGRLRFLETNGALSAPVKGTPAVRAEGQGGLMDVAPHPDYARTGWIYLSYSDRGSNELGANMGLTAVVRGRIRDGQWTDQEDIFRAPQRFYLPSSIHFGSRLVFDGQGSLFFTMGERGRGDHAQSLERPNGKVHRVREDGSIPADNPFAGKPGAIGSIWSYGHRNPQGLARHPVTGELWETEHGPRGGDELNRILPGRNYGWPVITYGMNYDGSPITDQTAREGMVQPVAHWTPSIAVCGMAFCTGDLFPRWKNNLFVTALAGQELRRIVLMPEGPPVQEVIFKNIGRVRAVTSGPDGRLYVVLNKPDCIVRLVPAP